ncbi:uncharacterized protein A1O5_08446 [Cladophialophora psammophila CBS 110553]|uniref:Uncharacterized protein n=1 Tax=Cladophialophora psammophila CBS 110553 TaxID=1182543 RepID=W9WKG4_9EURO|nr:uncharacterized protein A1O5_08446 [Cladophialophora psammophila CBS 110553]EXJ68652.1 hypothetical protein A1O5_08446 [Cladophialophora psammophila CBS 110553]
MSEPQQTPTPENTPGGKKPSRPGLERSNSDQSTTSADDQGYESRSRSQSRRRRRQNQRQRQAQARAQAGNASATSMASIDEGYEPQQQQQVARRAQPSNLHPGEQGQNPQWLKNPDPRSITAYQPFERIKPPSESMQGPVTYARMLRGEIPWRGPPPTQPLETAQPIDAKDSSGKDPMDQDGLKLRLELNLDIEIELKASIHGDLTLALL